MYLASRDGRLKKWTIKDDNIIDTLDLCTIHTISCMKIAKDGKTIFAGTIEGDIIETDTETGVMVRFIKDAHFYKVTCMEISSDQNFMFTASKDLKKWCTQTGENLIGTYKFC